MFTESELQEVAAFCGEMRKQAAWTDPNQFNEYSMGMPALKPWAPPEPTLGGAFKHMFTGVGRNLGTAAQTVLTGKNNPGILENVLGNGIKLLSHPTDPQRFRNLFSMRNFTDPIRRAGPEFRQDWRQTSEFPGLVAKDLGERYDVLRGVFNGPGRF